MFCLSLDIENSVYSKIIDLHGICLLRILLRFYASFQIEYGLKTQLYVKLEVQIVIDRCLQCNEMMQKVKQLTF